MNQLVLQETVRATGLGIRRLRRDTKNWTLFKKLRHQKQKESGGGRERERKERRGGREGWRREEEKKEKKDALCSPL